MEFNETLNYLSRLMMDHIYVAPLIALLAGVLSSMLPCSLSMLPIIIGYLGGESKGRRESLIISICYACGTIISLTALGIMAALLGRIFNQQSKIFFLVIGVLMILMALQTWGFITIIKSTNLGSWNTRGGRLGAFIAGLLAGIFSSPCSTPIIIALMAMISIGGNMIVGILALLLYGVGNSVLIILTGLFIGRIQEYIKKDAYSGASKAIRFILGLLILVLGFYILYLGL